MGISSSGSIVFTNDGAAPSCVQLGVHARGTLQRLVVAKEAGTINGGAIRVYDRRGACVGQPDFNTKNGVIVSLADNGGNVRLTSATPHGLSVGDEIEFKDAARVVYPGIYTVSAHISATVVDLNVAFVSNAAGLWQTKPWMPTLLPQMHSILHENVGIGGNYSTFDLGRGYENRDNQDPLTRRRQPALWLEYTPAAGSGTATFQVAYTSVSAETI